MTDTPCATDPDVMYPDLNNRPAVARARAVCATCPLVAPCLEAALEHEASRPGDLRYGVWGGTTPIERTPGLRPKPDVVAQNGVELAPWLAKVEALIHAGLSLRAIGIETSTSQTAVRARLIRHRRDLYDLAKAKPKPKAPRTGPSAEEVRYQAWLATPDGANTHADLTEQHALIQQDTPRETARRRKAIS